MSVPVYIERAGDCDEIAAYNETTPVTGLSKWVQPNPSKVALGNRGIRGSRSPLNRGRLHLPSWRNSGFCCLRCRNEKEDTFDPI